VNIKSDLCVNRSLFTIFRANIGLSDGAIPEDDNLWIGGFLNSYGNGRIFWFECLLAGERHPFELPDGSIQPEPRNVGMNVMGCGLVLDSDNKLAIFFTSNGYLSGEFVQEVLRIDKNKLILIFYLIFTSTT
jgi:hypothetical protein